MSKTNHIQYFLLSQEEGKGNYSRKFPAYEKNIALKVIFQAILEELILGKNKNCLKKMKEFVFLFTKLNDLSRYRLPELDTKVFEQ